MKLRKLKEEEVTFTFEAESEDLQLEGFFDSGDPAADAADIAAIRKRLEQDDIYAWFCAKVTVKWNGFSAHATLGACSYADEKDFMKDEYYAQLKQEALEYLNAEIQEKAEVWSELEEK